MDARPRRPLGVAIPLSLLGGLLSVGAPALAATHEPPPTSPTPASVDLPMPLRGERALDALDGQLHAAASANDLTPGALTDVLREDRAAWLDESGRLYYQEPTAAAPSSSADSAAAAESVAPLPGTFRLHSKPGSLHTIYLDFDGGTVSRTAWHAAVPATPTTHPAWDPSRNGPAFSDDERTRVQAIWAAVAEDYAAFDVDVTTEDPGPDAIRRTSTTDLTYGAHALITPTTADDVLCNGTCGGLAYVGTVGKVDLNGGGNGYGYRAPAWVFPQNLAHDTKSIAEAISHEVGHNLGLSHDGAAGTAYYYGHGSWAPIMGVGYNRPITQWSAGTYAGATQQQDDVAIIANKLGQRADEAAGGISGAAAPPADPAYLSNSGDVDTFRLGRCSGAVTVRSSTADVGPSADLRLTLLDSSGSQVASADPLSTMVSRLLASGLDASISRTLEAGVYYVSVRGTGRGSWTDGYDDYGSLGSYDLQVTGCDTAASVPSSTSTTLTSDLSGNTATLAAEVSSSAGAPSGSVQFFEDGAPVGTPVPLVEGRATLVRSDLAEGAHAWSGTFVPRDVTLWERSTSPVVTGTVLPTTTPPASDPPPAVAPVDTSTALSGVVNDRRVTLQSSVTTADGTVASGSVDIFEGATRVSSVPLVDGRATAILRKVEYGFHKYVAVFTPADGSQSASTSPEIGLRVSRIPSSTTVQIPGATARGTRPLVRVTVMRDDQPVTGRVVLRYAQRTTVVRVREGRGTVRLPKIRAPRLRVVARYPGDARTRGSRAGHLLRMHHR